MTPDGQLELGPATGAGVALGKDIDIVDAELVTGEGDAVAARATDADGLVACNLFGEADRVAARASERRDPSAVRSDLSHVRVLAARAAGPPTCG